MTQDDSTPDTASQPKVEVNTGEPPTVPVAHTSSQAWATVWRKLGRWLTIGVVSIILFVSAYLITHTARLRNSHQRGYEAGRASFGYPDAEALRKEAEAAVRQTALDEMGLGVDDFLNGSGWYLVEIRVAPRSQPGPSGVFENVDVTFHVGTPIKTDKWYGLSSSGTLTTHGE